MLTLLAPARDCEVARAAIEAGADAVYIGAPRYGARQAAGNAVADIAALVQYAHVYGVQILVTLNTLLNEEEKADALDLIHQLYQVGVDALIIQDMSLLQQSLPPIRLHASTQCDNRTAQQVIRLQQLGFKRVVLARELSLDQIRSIHDAVNAYSKEHACAPIELEAFVHGALCVSYSGQCFMSEVLLNRSANRGCCAQMCRMRYDLLDESMQEVLDADGKPVHQRYLLSLQDMDRSLYLEQMIQAGVTTFKIEGRLKDKDYVTNIVAYYRQRLDALMAQHGEYAQGYTPHVYEYGFVPNPEKTFHRGGIDYFLHHRTAPMANWDTPKSTGEKVTDQTILHPGDGLCFGDQGFAINAIHNGHIVPNKPISIPHNVPLYRNLDVDFTRHLTAKRRIPVTIEMEEIPTGFRLRIGHRSAEFVYPHQAAQHSERALATIREQLSKLGDTPYVAQSVVLRTQPYFIPISQLNQWRRQLTTLQPL